jgi:hypothetical protein
VVQYRTRRMLGYCRKNAVDFTDPNAGRGGALEAGKLAQRSTRRTHGRDFVAKISHGFYQKGGGLGPDIGRAS